jgi:hypothetical protein
MKHDHRKLMRVMLVGAVAAMAYYFIEANFKTWFEA